MPFYGYLIFEAGWLLWMVPFFRALRKRHKTVKIDRRARWGLVFYAIAFSLLWQGKFWERPLPAWRTAVSVLLFSLGIALSWTGGRALGRQWTVEAGLNADHELVTWGPYRLVRHPIYTSMLLLLLATGSLLSPWPLLLAAVISFVIGTEIRVRVEDHLLDERFGEKFRQYQSRVPAYVPFIR
ncbi:MAG: isoprenylcysteine carboxylmethyltransferase family protein [Bryobacteraceae bacterium]